MRLSLSLLLFTGLAARGQLPPSDDHSVHLDDVVVSATPFERDQSHLASATNLLSGFPLQLKLSNSLGETLAGQPGISSTYFGPGSSRPVIRGMGEDRIRILSNGVGTIDASVVSPDHAVALDPLLIERIEVVRGPAALLYGGNAVGGVVNVIDHRIHHRTLDQPVTGRGSVRVSSVDDGTSGALLAEGGTGRISWHVDAYRRTAEDLRIPDYALTSARRREEWEEDTARGEPFEPAHGRLPNSASESDGGAVGFSFSSSRGFVGVSLSGHNALYGIPAGAHHHGGDAGEEAAAPAEEEHAEDGVTVDLRQRRLDLQGELKAPLPGFTLAKLKLGIARYRHQELEGDEVSTVFRNRGYDGRLELTQVPIGKLQGAVGVQASRSRLSAEGEEAFLPTGTVGQVGLFAFEELALHPLTYQFGARLEHQQISLRDGSGRSQGDTGVSVSAGAVWERDENWNLAVSISHTQRQPNLQELYADGPHAGTSSYEQGDDSLSAEKSLAMEVSLRRRAGRVTGEATLFVNRFDGYVFPRFSGEEDPEHNLPVYRHTQTDAVFVGAEFSATIHLHEGRSQGLDLVLTADLVRAEETDSETPLPRITPRRAGATLDYSFGSFRAGVGTHAVERARHLAPGETPTAGHVLLSAYLGYRWMGERYQADVFVRGENLTDQTARIHGSFLKDLAPLPGRNVSVGVTVAF